VEAIKTVTKVKKHNVMQKNVVVITFYMQINVTIDMERLVLQQLKEMHQSTISL